MGKTNSYSYLVLSNGTDIVVENHIVIKRGGRSCGKSYIIDPVRINENMDTSKQSEHHLYFTCNHSLKLEN